MGTEPMEQSQFTTSLRDIKDVAKKFLRLTPSDENMIDMAMATYMANKLDADPVWLGGVVFHVERDGLQPVCLAALSPGMERA